MNLTRTICLLIIATSINTAYAKSGEEIIRDLGLKSEVTPMLTTEWCQEGAENALLPMIGKERTLTGCGVTATAQVMKYWSTPVNGYGENYYIWDKRADEREVRFADFSSTHYDWTSMIPRYKDNASALETEILAVATLMRDLGVALQVKYESTGTATNIEYISTVLKKYFGYNPTMTIHRYRDNVYTMDEWLGMIYKELSEGRPIIMGGSAWGAEHIYVADGYDASGKVHLNLGHAYVKEGSINTNGYYDLTRTDQTYTQNMRMLIGISPRVIDIPTPEFYVEKAGTLQEVLGGETQCRRICRMKLHGYLNDDDFKCMKKLSAITTGQLSYIDMADVIVEGEAIPEDAFRDSYTLQEIILPTSVKNIGEKAFMNTDGLWKVTLPERLECIGNYAFSGCRYLESLTFPASLSSIGANPMRYVHLSDMKVAEGNEDFAISNHALCDKNKTTLYAMPYLWTDEYRVEDGIKRIDYHAFSMQSMIPAIHLPSSVTKLMRWTFFECLSLKDFYVAAEEPPFLGDDNFSKETLATCTLHIPPGSMSLYLESDWRAFQNIVEDESLMTPLQLDATENITIQLLDLNGLPVHTPTSGGLYVRRYPGGKTEKIIY